MLLTSHIKKKKSPFVHLKAQPRWRESGLGLPFNYFGNEKLLRLELKTLAVTFHTPVVSGRSRLSRVGWVFVLTAAFSFLAGSPLADAREALRVPQEQAAASDGQCSC